MDAIRAVRALQHRLSPAPQYLMDCCIPISHVASRRHLRSAKCHHLVVPQHNLSMYGRRAFAVAVARPTGTHWVTICVIWRLALTVSDVCLVLVCFQCTSTYSALKILYITSCKYLSSSQSCLGPAGLYCLGPAGLYCLGPAGLCPPYLSRFTLEFSQPLQASVRSFITIRQVAPNDLD